MKPGLVTLSQTLVLAIVITGLGSSIASAEAPAPSATSQTVLLGTPEFARLVKGKKVIVTTSDGKEQKGDFEVAPTGLVKSRWKDGRKIPGQVVPFDQIVKVQKATARVRNFTLLGVAAGVGIALGSTWSGCPARLDEHLLMAGIGAGLGAVSGATVGAVLNTRNRKEGVIYDAAGRTTTMSFAPILSPTRKGMAFSVTWR